MSVTPEGLLVPLEADAAKRAEVAVIDKVNRRGGSNGPLVDDLRIRSELNDKQVVDLVERSLLGQVNVVLGGALGDHEVDGVGGLDAGMGDHLPLAPGGVAIRDGVEMDMILEVAGLH